MAELNRSWLYCLWGDQYGGGILRYVPKIRTPSLRLYNKRQMLIWGKSVDRPILTGCYSEFSVNPARKDDNNRLLNRPCASLSISAWARGALYYRPG